MSNKPIDTIRDGILKATIWKNVGENGDFYTVDFTRTYKQGEDLKDTNSFNPGDLLKVSRLAHKAYDRIGELKNG